jgi:uncharacterized protein YecE (DUF72 family)
VASRLFYPPQAKDAASRLLYYSEHFSLAEVDATYYSILPSAVAERWASLTPADFRFDVKAYPVLTGHPIEIRRLPSELRSSLGDAGLSGRRAASELPPELVTELERRFAAMLTPLRRAEKLASILLQFPPWFTATRGNARWIEQVAERWARWPLSVEFRHPSWLAEPRRARVLQLLARLQLSYVCVDEPDTEVGGVPPVAAVTAPRLAVVRMHGQNRGGWRRGASVHERFAYLYSAAELRRWLPVVERLSEEAEQVHVVFNNCVRNYAVINAKGFCTLLEGRSR